MWEYKYEAAFGYEEKTVLISEVSGYAGAMFHIMVEKYYYGSIFRAQENTWLWHSPSKSLNVDDAQV